MLSKSPLRNAVNATPFAFGGASAQAGGNAYYGAAQSATATTASATTALMANTGVVNAPAGVHMGGNMAVPSASTLALRGSTMITPNPFSQLSHDALVGAASVAQEHCR